MTKWFEKYMKGDKVIIIVVILLTIFSLLAVYSSTGTLAYKTKGGNTEYYLLKHLIIVLLGFVLMFGAYHIPYKYFSRLSQVAILLAVPLLVITLISGTSKNEAVRWITLPVINITFQTSDFAKLALIMYLARILTKKQEIITDFKSAFLPLMIPVLIVCALILPANFSTAAVLFTTSLILMFIGRVSIKHIGLLVGTGVVGFALFVSFALLSGNPGRVETWMSRAESHFNKEGDESYQVQHAKMAIASGGVFGKGPGNCMQSDTLPHPYSDFIFAIIIGEYGMIGGALVVLLYLIFFFRSVRIITKSPRTFAALLVAGCSFSLVFQAMINMAVAVNLFPVTGQPLPLVSMGGTSIWFTSIAIGIVLSVSKDIESEQMEHAGAKV
jgi:cell division protein FtsW